MNNDFFDIKNSVNRVDKEELNIFYDDLSFIQALSRCMVGSIFVINYETKGFDYVFGDTSLLGGYSSEEVREMGYDFYNKVVPEKDLALLIKINRIGFDFFEKLSLQDRNKYTITYDYHICNPFTKKRILVNQKLTPMVLTKSGKIWKSLCIISFSSEKEASNIKLINHHGGKNLHYNLDRECWISEDIISFSDREKEIIQLSIRGFSLQEIASKIHISIETVKFHRRKIFEKLKVDNITDVITFIMKRNLL